MSYFKATDNILLQQFLRGHSDGPVPFHANAEPFNTELAKVNL